MTLLLISFVAGVLTVLAPCILPLLPVVVGGSLASGKPDLRKALTIIGSLGASVLLFTFLLKASTLLIDVPPQAWTWLSGGIIVAVGIAMLVPALWETRFMARLSAASNRALGAGERRKSAWGDVIVGAALGPVFTTCSPTYFIVLATVLPVSVVAGIVYLLAYALGLCTALLGVAVVGQRIMGRLGLAADPRGTFKRAIGALFVIVGIAVLAGFDKSLQATILDAGFFDVTKIEQRLLEFGDDSALDQSGDTSSEPIVPDSAPAAEEDETVGSSVSGETAFVLPEEKPGRFSRAIEISTPDAFINTDGRSIAIQELIDEDAVVLLDIWTYSCINCQRTIPYLNAWHEKYADDGLVIIGLHTPEFAFERDPDNVEDAVDRLGIEYPVVLDNDYSTWRAYGNRFWPRKYLIDVDGYVVYDHIGEGAYDATERAIRFALEERAARLGIDADLDAAGGPLDAVVVDFSSVKSPEIYFGSDRNERLGNGQTGRAGSSEFELPPDVDPNTLYLSGPWDIEPEHAESGGEASIVFSYEAKNVYMVASADGPITVEVFKDGTFERAVLIGDETLYTLIEGSGYGSHRLEIRIPEKGLRAFTLTFG